MKRRLTVLCVLALVLGLVTMANPVAAMPDDCGAQCAAAPWDAYWNGCACGGEFWSPTCVYCEGDTCVTDASSGWASCHYHQGSCYGYATCHYTG